MQLNCNNQKLRRSSQRKRPTIKRKRLALPLRRVSRFCRQEKPRSGAEIPEISIKSAESGAKHLIFG